MKSVKGMYIVIIPYLIILSLIPLSLILIPKYGYQISRYFANKSNPQKVPYLYRDFMRTFDKGEDYIDFRDSFSESFNRIIIIDLGYNISDFSTKYDIQFNELEIKLDEYTKELLRDKVNEIDDFQLIMFFSENQLIRYQEIEKSHGLYYFPTIESQEFHNLYKFTRFKTSNGSLTTYLIPYVE